MERYSDLINEVVACFDGKVATKEDLYNYSCAGLVKALDNYSQSNPIKFDTYARAMIVGEVRRQLQNKKKVKLMIEIKEIVCTPISDVAIAAANDLCDRFKQASGLRLYSDGYEQALKDLGIRKAPEAATSKGK